MIRLSCIIGNRNVLPILWYIFSVNCISNIIWIFFHWKCWEGKGKWSTSVRFWNDLCVCWLGHLLERGPFCNTRDFQALLHGSPPSSPLITKVKGYLKAHSQSIFDHGTHWCVPWLARGSTPNISILPGYYCPTRMASNINPRKTLSRGYTPPTATLISQACLVDYDCIRHVAGFISPSRNLRCLATMYAPSADNWRGEWWLLVNNWLV